MKYVLTDSRSVAVRLIWVGDPQFAKYGHFD
jgi:hypothetical protein